MTIRAAFAAAILCLPAFGVSPDWITVDKNGAGFIQAASGARFIPWGLNYSRDDKFRLIEDYWDADGPEGWAKVDRDFREMKHLGANVVRIHLQFEKFMDAPDKPNQRSLARLAKLITLSEDLGLYLDITGLGTYRVADVPAWYRNASEKQHWAEQAEFWHAIAPVCAGHPGVFALSVMNEPIATSAKRAPGDWTHPAAMQGLQYIEFINLDPAGHKPPDIAKAWLNQMTQAIRKYDSRHLITVGLLWIDDAHPENGAGFPPRTIAPDVDFLAIHVYPEKGKVDVALKSLARYKIGKPILVEETFPLRCPPMEFADFIQRSRGIAAGWLEHYWSKTPEDLKDATDPADRLLLRSLELFQNLNPNR